MRFLYDNLQLRYEPFPIGLVRPILDDVIYRDLVNHYPDIELFESHAAYGKAGNKYALTEKLNPKKYYQFIQSSPQWNEFHQWVTSDAFISETFSALKEKDIDLGYEFTDRAHQLKRRLKDLAHGRLCPRQRALEARFEFSALPANGGMVVPHTDARRKLVTIVVSMMKDGEWKQEYGGGLDINKPKDPRLNFNLTNRHADFDEMEVIDTFEFLPNQAVLFIKTFNSWHSVRPMQGPDSSMALRKTLTINIQQRY
jgi:hypothetical protein